MKTVKKIAAQRYKTPDAAAPDIFSEMLAAGTLVRDFNPAVTAHIRRSIEQTNGNVLIAGEGSSIMFPAGNLIDLSRKGNISRRYNIQAIDATSALKVNHNDATILLMSNSGKTAPLVTLANELTWSGHQHFYTITAHADSPLGEICKPERTIELACGMEDAVAATKSVMNQALILQSLLPDTVRLNLNLMRQRGEYITALLNEMTITPDILDKFAAAKHIHISGPANGVANELALKFAETIRKVATPYPQLQVTHGYQGAMRKRRDVALFFGDYTQTDQQHIHNVLKKETRIDIVAADMKPTIFPTILMPGRNDSDFNGYFQLAAGWKIMLELARHQGLDINQAPGNVKKVGDSIHARHGSLLDAAPQQT